MRRAASWCGAATLILAASTVLALDPDKAITQLAHSSWRDELPQNTIHAILQSSDGYLWFGTYEGLVRFDGVRFEVFDAVRTKDLPGTAVFHLAEDERGRLWIATNGGLAVLEQGRFRSFTTNDGLPSDVVSAVLARSDGSLLVGTDKGLCSFSDGRCSPFEAAGSVASSVRALAAEGTDVVWVATDRGLVRLQGDRVTRYSTAEGLPANLCRAVWVAAAGGVWVGTSGGLVRVTPGEVIQVLTTAHGLPDDFVAALAEDREGSLWIGTEGGGLARLAAGVISSYSSRDGLSHNYVRSLFEDREGNLWVGTNGGLNQLRDAKIMTITTREGLAADFVRVVMEDRQGDVWVGTDGGGLCRFRAGEVSCLGAREGLPSLSVRALAEGHDGSLWVGTRGGVHRWDGARFATISVRDGLSTNLVRALLKDRQGTLWVGTEGGGLDRIRNGRVEPVSAAQEMPSGDVRALFEDSQGRLWIGTYGGLGLWHDGHLRVLRVADGLPNDIVFAITEDSLGNIWVGTDRGLALLEPGRITSFTVEHGLFDNKVFQILLDGEWLWMSSNRGISRVRLDQLYARARGEIEHVQAEGFNRADGMRVNQCNGSSQPAGWRRANGELWFPTAEGVAVASPARMRFNHLAPPVLIEEVVANRKPVDVRLDSELGPSLRELELHYTALSFVAPDRVRFRYRLEGFDTRWVEAGSRRSAYFTNVPPGRYRFVVTACNNDGVWNPDGAVWAFEVKAPVWQSWWAYLLYLGLGGGLAWLGVWLRMRALHHRTRLLEGMVAARTAEVEASNRALAEKAEEAEISERRAIASERRALEASRAKSIFLSNMSHELRTPLNSIIGFAAILIDRLAPQLDPRHARFLRNIHGSGEHLLRLINTILDLSKIEAGRMELQLEALQLAPLLYEMEGLMRGVAAQSEIDIDVRVPEELPDIVADPIKLKQVMFNLLSNAVKFSPPRATVVVDTRWVASVDSQIGVDAVCVEIIDRGIGIRPEDQEIIFQEFRQLDDGANRRFAGTGLGLPLARRLVELHGGVLTVRSALGQGSTFTVVLPVMPRRVL